MDPTQNSAVVPINGGPQKLFVNRYQFLSTNDDLVPKNFKLYQNSPNPFNPNTNIRFDLPKNESISLMIYNIAGKEVAQINRNNLSAGSACDQLERAESIRRPLAKRFIYLSSGGWE